MLNPDESQQVRRNLENHLNDRGLDLDEFSQQIRDFFDDSYHHYDRLALQEALAGCLGLDLSQPKSRKEFLATIADFQNISRKVRCQWETGEIDVPILLLQRCLPRFRSAARQFNEYIKDEYGPVRMAIARSIVLGRVFPSLSTSKNASFMSQQPADLKRCWNRLRIHPHYETGTAKPRRKLNQHALDSVKVLDGDNFWIEADSIGRVMLATKQAKYYDDPWIFPFLIFRAATYPGVTSTNHKNSNHLRWIWEKDDPDRYNAIWGLK